MLSSMPGKGLGMAAKRIGEAAARPMKKKPEMEILKKKLAPMKAKKPMPRPDGLRNSMPLEKVKTMPLNKGIPSRKLKNLPMPLKKRDVAPGDKTGKPMPSKAQPSWMRKDYEPGSIKRGYTKYA